MTKNKSKKHSFEESMLKLESILHDIENNKLTLNQLVDSFEQGSKLSKECIEHLKNAKLKINKLIESNDEFQIKELKWKS